MGSIQVDLAALLGIFVCFQYVDMNEAGEGTFEKQIRGRGETYSGVLESSCPA